MYARFRAPGQPADPMHTSRPLRKRITQADQRSFSMKFSWLKAASIAIAASTGLTLVAVSLQARAQAPAYHLSDEGETGEVAPAAVEMEVADSLDAADYASVL